MANRRQFVRHPRLRNLFPAACALALAFVLVALVGVFGRDLASPQGHPAVLSPTTTMPHATPTRRAPTAPTGTTGPAPSTTNAPTSTSPATPVTTTPMTTISITLRTDGPPTGNVPFDVFQNGAASQFTLNAPDSAKPAVTTPQVAADTEICVEVPAGWQVRSTPVQPVLSDPHLYCVPSSPALVFELGKAG